MAYTVFTHGCYSRLQLRSLTQCLHRSAVLNSFAQRWISGNTAVSTTSAVGASNHALLKNQGHPPRSPSACSPHLHLCKTHLSHQQVRQFSSGVALGASRLESKNIVGRSEAEELVNPYTNENISFDDPLVDQLYQGVISGSRGGLARSITLVESTHPKKKAQAQVLLARILRHNRKKMGYSLKSSASFRIGKRNN